MLIWEAKSIWQCLGSTGATQGGLKNGRLFPGSLASWIPQAQDLGNCDIQGKYISLPPRPRRLLCLEGPLSPSKWPSPHLQSTSRSPSPLLRNSPQTPPLEVSPLSGSPPSWKFSQPTLSREPSTPTPPGVAGWTSDSCSASSEGRGPLPVGGHKVRTEGSGFCPRSLSGHRGVFLVGKRRGGSREETSRKQAEEC